MGGTREKKQMNHGEIEDFLSVLSEPEIKSNCTICQRLAKVNNMKTALEVFKMEDHVRCKKCLFSISKRKYALLYTIEFLVKYNKKYFTVENIRRYVIDEFEHGDEIVNTLAIIMRDLISLGVIGIYNKQYNGHRYVVLNMERIHDHDVSSYALLRGFGFKDGIKYNAET